MSFDDIFSWTWFNTINPNMSLKISSILANILDEMPPVTFYLVFTNCQLMRLTLFPPTYLCPKMSPVFLAHLSQRLNVSYCDWSLSVVCPSVCCRRSINVFFKQHLFLNHWSKFHITWHECSPWCLINVSTPPKRRAARAPDKKSFKWHLLLNHWAQFKIISQNCSSGYLLPKLGTLRWTIGLPELQIRTIIKRHFIQNHWFKSKMISQDCS